MSKRVVVAQFSHETNTFSVQPADVAAFESRLWAFGARVPTMFSDTNTEMAGILDVAEAYDWTLTHTVSAAANPSGRVTDDVWRRVVDAILEPLDSGARVDGVVLALHGAMATCSHDDAESVLLERVRQTLGDAIPIAVTLDLHANVGADSARLADIICSYKTYPHIDMRVCGRRAAELLQQAMSGATAPVCHYARAPMVEGADGGRTDVEPMLSLLAKAQRFEAEAGCLYVSINAGFAHADVPETGPSVVVTSNGGGARYQEMADELMDDIWQSRAVVNNTYLSVDAAVAEALCHQQAGRPVIIADYADNPGAGSYGDATNLLRAMLEAEVEAACFGALRDAEAVRQLSEAGIGAEVELEIGAKVDPTMGGEPLAVRGTVVSLTDGSFIYDGPMWAGMPASLGASAVLRVRGVDVLLTTNLAQVLDLQQFRSNGIEPTHKRIVALKSMQHFRAAFEPIAERVLVCDSGALASPDLNRLPYERLRRPIYPFDLA